MKTKAVSNVKMATVATHMLKGANQPGVRLGAVGKRCVQFGTEQTILAIVEEAKRINGKKRTISKKVLCQAAETVVPSLANAPVVEEGTVPKFLLPKKRARVA